MKDQAIALCRVSSKEQLLSNSLDIQGINVQSMADELGVPIVKKWALHTSSKKGKNLKRKDLVEAKNLCKSNKNIKYILFDRVNRLGREAKYLTFYMLDLEINLGVQLIFCDPSQKTLNGTDPNTFLKRVEKLVQGEMENEEKSSLAIERMRSRVTQGYYPFNVHPGYKKTDTKDGLHIPDNPRFKQLQEGCLLIIYKSYTVQQAVRAMNDNGYRTIGGKKLDVNHFETFIADTYYCGLINIKKPGWPKDVPGLHSPMLSKREHQLLVGILSKRNPRIRQKHNPDFVMSALFRHQECMGKGGYEKMTGVWYNGGKRPSGTQKPLKPVYDCRDCRQRVSRELAHKGFTEHLATLNFIPSSVQFKKALLKVWTSQRGSVAQRLAVLKSNRANIEQRLKETAIAYAAEPPGAAKEALHSVLQDYDAQIKELDIDITATQATDVESEDFVNFALNFVERLREKWWRISWENMARGEQILFNGKIYVDNSATVRTPLLSSIYRLGTNKKALSNVDNAHLVELPEYRPPGPLDYLC